MAQRPDTFDDYSRASQYRILAHARKADELSSTDSDEDNMCDQWRNINRDSDDNRSGDEHSNLNSPVNELRNDNDGGDEAMDLPEEEWSDASEDVAELQGENELHGSNSENESGHSTEPENTEDSSTESSESSESDDDQDREDDIDSPIYPGAPLLIGESLIAVLVFMLRHKLSWSCLTDMLALINLHCISPNPYFKSLYRFRKFFENLKAPLIRHYYCSGCFSKLSSPNSQCSECNGTEGSNYFIEIPILAQLAALFKREGFYRSLNYRFDRQKKSVENYEDIYDGTAYKSIPFLSDRSNISLTWNTDGVPLYKSSKFSIWPFYFTINELPYHLRSKRENMILGGMWFGSKKPQANLFLSMFREGLQALYRGVHFEVADLNRLLRVRGILLCGTCDLPAKAVFLNMKQYNGIFGCHKCTIASKKVDTVRVYPYKRNLRLRTSAETINYARKAYRLKTAVKGVKGPTALAHIAHDYIVTTTIDVMHCLYLGVVKKLMTLWFSAAHSTHPSSLVGFVKVVNKRISAIHPPSIVQRLPRTITDWKYWKASEFKVWFLYFSLSVLEGIMAPHYFDHHKLLVIAMTLLNLESISPEMIVQASRAIHEYIARFEDLYGLRHMTCNLHLLLHLPDEVRNFGPLWITSCFPFEDANGLLKSLVHGTRYAQLQICSAVSIFFNLEELKSRLLLPQGATHAFCEKLEKRKQRRRKVFRIFDGTFVVGKLTTLRVLPQLIIEAFDRQEINIGNVYWTFQRLYKNGVLYDCESYNKKKKTNSSCVKYELNNESGIGIIQTFVQVSQCACDEICLNCNSNYYAILKKCQTSNRFESSMPGTRISSIHSCSHTQEDTVLIINVDCLQTICFQIDDNSRPDGFYIIEPVNTVEFE